MHSLAVVTIYRVFYKFLGLNQSFLKLEQPFDANFNHSALAIQDGISYKEFLNQQYRFLAPLEMTIIQRLLKCLLQESAA